MAVYLNNNMINIGSYINLKPMVLRPDAELIQTYNADYKAVEDNDITLPAYSTSSQTLIATTNLTPTITLDYNNYNYFVSERALVIPEYNIDTKSKGRVEYQMMAYNVELVEIPANTFKSLDKTKTYASRYVPAFGQSYYMEIYWSSATAIAPYATGTYGIIPAANAPTISSGVLTIKTPTINLRGHTTYFTSTYFNALTDIRIQYVIQVYRAPKNNLSVDGWSALHSQLKITNDIENNNNYVLT